MFVIKSCDKELTKKMPKITSAEYL